MKWLITIFCLLFAGCVDSGPWVYHKDGNYGPAWWDDKQNAGSSAVEQPPVKWPVDGSIPSLHVSDSAPEALKPYYDPELTKKLNERTYTIYPTWEKWLIDPLHYDSSVW